MLKTSRRQSIREAAFAQIGGTPIVKVSLEIGGEWRTIHLKLEGHNPAGSIKDRTAAWLIRDLEDRRILTNSSVIVESTSGNLGVALAFLSLQLGYRFLAVIDPRTTPENRRKMQNFGAMVELVDQPDENGGYLLSRLRRIEEICQQSSRYVWTDQYSNPANPLSHYRSTGPEIYRQLGGRVDAVFVAVSTGGTLAGIARFFREVSPGTAIVAVDAHGSVIFGGPPSPRKLTGIGSSRRSTFIRREHYDAQISVIDRHAFAACRQLYAETGIRLGGSSGTVLYACVQYLAEHPERRNVVCICADGGDNYASTIFDNAWMNANGFDPAEAALGIGAAPRLILAPAHQWGSIVNLSCGA
jgi:N-(2-amino-2-carboxyethyl)-L-glutamate synthase